MQSVILYIERSITQCSWMVRVPDPLHFQSLQQQRGGQLPHKVHRHGVGLENTRKDQFSKHNNWKNKNKPLTHKEGMSYGFSETHPDDIKITWRTSDQRFLLVLSIEKQTHSSQRFLENQDNGGKKNFIPFQFLVPMWQKSDWELQKTVWRGMLCSMASPVFSVPLHF